MWEIKKHYKKSRRRGNPTNNKKNDNWVGHILRRGCLRKHPTEGMIVGCIEVKGGQGRTRNQLLDGLRGY